MVLIVDEGDGEFSGLEQVSDEELIEIFGNVILEASSADPKYGELGPQPAKFYLFCHQIRFYFYHLIFINISFFS